MLARWVLDAGFLPFLQPVLRFMVPMGVIWHAWCLYFGVLEDPGTILGRSWNIGGHKEGPCEVQAWSLLVFGSKFGCLRLEKQAFGIEGIAKINFCRNGISHDSRVDCS